MKYCGLIQIETIFNVSLDLSSFYFFLFYALILSLVIILFSWILGEKSPSADKISVYECGFNPFHAPGEPFSIRFFIIGILFIIFDLEIALLFPWATCMSGLNLLGQTIMFTFIFILTLGLIYEWYVGGLKWE